MCALLRVSLNYATRRELPDRSDPIADSARLRADSARMADPMQIRQFCALEPMADILIEA